MEQEQIPLEEFCSLCEVEVSFIHSLNDSGLISIKMVQESHYIPVEEMPRLERFVRLHYDLDINLEGLETIDHLLHKVEMMQEELRMLRSRVDYEL